MNGGIGRTMVVVLLSAVMGSAWVLAEESNVFVIQGAKIHTLAGPPIEKGNVLIREGRIAAVGVGVTAPEGAQVIDAAGLEVHAGFFDSMSRLGLTEVGSVPATVDTTEIGAFNPQVQAAAAINAASDLIPVARANGVTHAVSAPGGGEFGGGGDTLVAGQAALVHLAGWTVEEMVIEPSVLMVLHWPRIETRSFDFSTFEVKEKPYKEAKKAYDDQVAELEEWLEAARHYSQATGKVSSNPVERDLKLEALGRVVAGQMQLVIVAGEARQIQAAVDFSERQKIRMILAGGAEAWKVKEILKEKNVPVILGPTQELPREEDEPYDKPFTNAAELHQAGVKIALATFGASNSRTLPYEAGHASAFGLPWEEALKAITLYPAQILGVDDRLGSIEEGKIANLIVTNGDPLEIQTEIRYVFVNGRPTSLDNKHRQLYEKYRARR